ncbi:hypothetical protein G7046_g1537 [Stylonectria norvegica]|nr:hypothetical protein G7046_g1537 [Stylonectria norvegica]
MAFAPADIHVWIGNYQASRGTRIIPEQSAVPRSYMYAESLDISEPGRRVPRSQHSRVSSASGATAHSAYFDTYYAETVSSVSTAPPLGGPTPSLRERPAVPTPSLLVCEFVRYHRCPYTFEPDNEEGWISHVSEQHLGFNFPAYCMCWFCPSTFEAISGEPVDRAACYRDRMHHIAGHFRRGATGNDMRPDFYFVDHAGDPGTWYRDDTPTRRVAGIDIGGRENHIIRSESMSDESDEAAVLGSVVGVYKADNFLETPFYFHIEAATIPAIPPRKGTSNKANKTAVG